jgi:hypothetical protein
MAYDTACDEAFYAYQLWKKIEINFSPNDLFFQVQSVWLDFLLPPKHPMSAFRFISHILVVSQKNRACPKLNKSLCPFFVGKAVTPGPEMHHCASSTVGKNSYGTLSVPKP